MTNNEFQGLNLDFEYLISEMELKWHNAKIKDVHADFSDAENKIRMIENLKKEFHELYYEKEKVEFEILKLKYQNTILSIEAIKLTKQNESTQ